MADLITDETTRILVVDDEEVIREILADFLEEEGFRVHCAPNGRRALEELSRQRFDLVLTDLKMPELGGLELLAAIQKHTPNIVTIIMTGFGTVETAIDAMKKGAYDYILKPFKVDEVVHVIRRALEKQKLSAENFRLKEALSLYKVSEAISQSLSMDQVVDTLVSAAIEEVQADVVSVILSDGEGGFFERHRSSGSEGSTRSNQSTLKLSLLQQHFEKHEALLAQGSEAQVFLEDVHTDVIESLMVACLRARREVVGFVAALSHTPGKRFDEGQRKLLHTVADRASAAIDNAKLYEDLQATFHQTIRGLASAIDKMDRYTAGHSARVAAYAQVLAAKIGLSEPEIEIVRQSALMHDIGKIGCVMNLNKPGKLSEQEYAVFKKHPEHGRDILRPIDFLHPLIPGVYLHHERWDGHGYPLGLRGQNVPLFARIISVADTYDAMTSDRAYRKALKHEVAVKEIKRCAGSQFDPEVADIFVGVIDSVIEEGPPSGDVDEIVSVRHSSRPSKLAL